MSAMLTKEHVERFFRRIEKLAEQPGCWLWTGTVLRDGYGQLWCGAAAERAHRVSWKIHNGTIPEGMIVCHKCDVRSCVRPDHLFLGSQKDNIADMIRKGRKASVRGERHPAARLTDHDVRIIRDEVGRGVKRTDIAKAFGVTVWTIHSVIRRVNWSHV